MATVQIPFKINPLLTGTVNAYPGVAAFTALDMPVIVFTQGVDGVVYGVADKVPAGLTISAAAIELDLFTVATSGVARVNVGLAAIADGEVFDFSSFTMETAQDVSMPGTAYQREAVSFSVANTTIAAGDIVVLRVLHEGSHTNDTLGSSLLMAVPRLVLTTS